MKPGRNDKKYSLFMKFNYLQWGILWEILALVRSLQIGKKDEAVFCIILILMGLTMFRNLLRVRHIVATFPKEELSDFLVKEVMTKGASCLSGNSHVLQFRCCFMLLSTGKAASKGVASEARKRDISELHYLSLSSNLCSTLRLTRLLVAECYKPLYKHRTRFHAVAYVHYHANCVLDN